MEHVEAVDLLAELHLARAELHAVQEDPRHRALAQQLAEDGEAEGADELVEFDEAAAKRDLLWNFVSSDWAGGDVERLAGDRRPGDRRVRMGPP